MQRLILIILSTFVFLASPALAKGRDALWVVSQRSGDARVIRSGLQPASLTVNSALVPGDIVMTGPTGRATLARGSDYIVVAPRSELRLPATPQPGGFTRIMQTLGTMLFKVQHTGTPHFAVETPMLAAVVKGTTFTVIVDRDRTAVQVTEGAVQVIATDGGMETLVEGGKTVFIDSRDPKRLITADAITLQNSASPSDGLSVRIGGSQGESLATIADLTAGLVRAEIAPVAMAPATQVVTAAIATAAPVDETGNAPSAPIVDVADPAATTPTLTTPVASATVPAVNSPGVTVPGVTVADVTTPALTVPTLTTPTVTVPTLTTPTVTVPTLTTPTITTPTVTVPTLTTPTVTIPTVTVPTVTVPTVTVPTVTVPTVTVPTVTVPTVTIPTVTVPTVTVPTVTVPTVTVPTVPVPTLPCPLCT